MMMEEEQLEKLFIDALVTSTLGSSILATK